MHVRVRNPSKRLEVSDKSGVDDDLWKAIEGNELPAIKARDGLSKPRHLPPKGALAVD